MNLKDFKTKAQILSTLSALALLSTTAIQAQAAPAPSANVAIPNSLAPRAHLAELEKFNRAFDQSKESLVRDVRITSEVEDTKAESSWLVKNCRIETFELNAYDPITSRPGRIQLRLYSPTQTPGPVRQVLLIPPTGGENVFDLGYADSLCSNGFQTAILEKWDGDDLTSLDLNMHDAGAVRALAAMRHSIEFINPEGQHPLAIFGTSVGAISSTLAMAYDNRIRSAILIVGGIGMSEIIANSHEKTLSALRAQRMAAFGYSDIASYERALAQHVLIDPDAPLANTQVTNALMFMADQDVTVPTPNQILLRDRLRNLGVNVTELHFSADHFSTIKKTFLSFGNRRKMLDFLNQTLR